MNLLADFDPLEPKLEQLSWKLEKSPSSLGENQSKGSK
jgi:hypothetical protein